MKKSKKKKMSYGHGGGYNKPMQKARYGMKKKMADGGKGATKEQKGESQASLDKQIIQIKKDMDSGKLSPEQARKKLLVIQSKMQNIGTIPKTKKMRKGGKLKKVNSKKNPGLAKLPTEVRNKMGYMAKGGKMDETMGSMARHGMKMKKAPGGMKMQGMKDRRRMMNNMMTYMGGGKMKTTYKSGGTYRQLD
jgi:hypothetical protein|tara:strand:+ start:388 stop:963 length:576 start_codon:yes stop_codon:yes gene_type:complete